MLRAGGVEAGGVGRGEVALQRRERARRVMAAAGRGLLAGAACQRRLTSEERGHRKNRDKRGVSTSHAFGTPLASACSTQWQPACKAMRRMRGLIGVLLLVAGCSGVEGRQPARGRRDAVGVHGPSGLRAARRRRAAVRAHPRRRRRGHHGHRGAASRQLAGRLQRDRARRPTASSSSPRGASRAATATPT